MKLNRAKYTDLHVKWKKPYSDRGWGQIAGEQLCEIRPQGLVRELAENEPTRMCPGRK